VAVTRYWTYGRNGTVVRKQSRVVAVQAKIQIKCRMLFSTCSQPRSRAFAHRILSSGKVNCCFGFHHHLWVTVWSVKLCLRPNNPFCHPTRVFFLVIHIPHSIAFKYLQLSHSGILPWRGNGEVHLLGSDWLLAQGIHRFPQWRTCVFYAPAFTEDKAETKYSALQNARPFCCLTLSHSPTNHSIR